MLVNGECGTGAQVNNRVGSQGRCTVEDEGSAKNICLTIEIAGAVEREGSRAGFGESAQPLDGAREGGTVCAGGEGDGAEVDGAGARDGA